MMQIGRDSSLNKEEIRDQFEKEKFGRHLAIARSYHGIAYKEIYHEQVQKADNAITTTLIV